MHIRKHLTKINDINGIGFGQKGKRSLLGISNVNEWIEEVNIGTVMHVEPISYEESSFASDIVYELSEKMLLEKVCKNKKKYKT